MEMNRRTEGFFVSAGIMHMHVCAGTFAVWGCKKHRITSQFFCFLCVLREQLTLSELPPSKNTPQKRKRGFEGSAVGLRIAEERMES